MLELSRVAPHEWEFVYPAIYDDLMDEFHTGCEAYEEGNLDEAERIFRAVLAQMPDHLDGIHHLALVLSKRGLLTEARDLWEQTSRIGYKAFPQAFELGRDRLEWGWLQNRPFLRCLHGLALALFKRGQRQEASVALLEAIQYLPLVAKELLKVKHRLPKTAMPDAVIMGGADEAYYYWEHCGQFWEEDTEALEWLRRTLRQATKPRRGTG